MRRPVTRKAQRGVALIVFATVLIMGFAWYAVGALNNAVPTAAEREIKTGLALQEARKALIAYVVQHAARSDTMSPGQLPCPEPLAPITEGEASTNCGNALVIGRLPWKTLGIDQLRDGYGEPLWYALSAGFRVAPINFSNVGQLTYNGTANAAVAVIMAPGPVLNTVPVPGVPTAGCVKASQAMAARNTPPLDPTLFLECGNATNNFRNLGSSVWTNDRAIAITAAEWADAIAPAIQDRLQREIAPVLSNWHTAELAATEASLGVGNGRSWGAAPPNGWNLNYLPFAATFADPSSGVAGLYCGAEDATNGLLPLEPTCHRNDWTGTATATFGLNVLGGGACSDFLGTHLRCRYQVAVNLFGLSTRITATVANAGRGFRSTIKESDVIVSNGGVITNMTMSFDADSDATAIIDVTWPGLLGLFMNVDVRIPHLQDAAVLTDPKLDWVRNNLWQRYVHYGVAAGATAGSGTSCANPTYTGCLQVLNFSASAGPINQKRLVLVLSGRPLGAHAHHSADLNDYFEYQNASAGVNYEIRAMAGDFNDRIATCPFRYQDHTGADVVICN